MLLLGSQPVLVTRRQKMWTPSTALFTHLSTRGQRLSTGNKKKSHLAIRTLFELSGRPVVGLITIIVALSINHSRQCCLSSSVMQCPSPCCKIEVLHITKTLSASCQILILWLVTASKAMKSTAYMLLVHICMLTTKNTENSLLTHHAPTAPNVFCCVIKILSISTRFCLSFQLWLINNTALNPCVKMVGSKLPI